MACPGGTIYDRRTEFEFRAREGVVYNVVTLHIDFRPAFNRPTDREYGEGIWEDMVSSGSVNNCYSTVEGE